MNSTKPINGEDYNYTALLKFPCLTKVLPHPGLLHVHSLRIFFLAHGPVSTCLAHGKKSAHKLHLLLINRHPKHPKHPKYPKLSKLQVRVIMDSLRQSCAAIPVTGQTRRAKGCAEVLRAARGTQKLMM